MSHLSCMPSLKFWFRSLVWFIWLIHSLLLLETYKASRFVWVPHTPLFKCWARDTCTEGLCGSSPVQLGHVQVDVVQARLTDNYLFEEVHLFSGTSGSEPPSGSVSSCSLIADATRGYRDQTTDKRKKPQGEQCTRPKHTIDDHTFFRTNTCGRSRDNDWLDSWSTNESPMYCWWSLGRKSTVKWPILWPLCCDIIFMH